MNLKCGIIGLPNVGKSTLFNALTSSQKAEVANYPFCTIDPNVGQATVPDDRLQKITDIFKPKKTIPTILEFVDIAGLVKGASQGEGLGNQFLSHIRETHSLLHVVRGFDNSQITSVHETTDPERDIEVIQTELLLADLEMINKRLQKIEKAAQTSGDKKKKEELVALKKGKEHLEKGVNLRDISWSEKEKLIYDSMHFITLKPILYICNQSEENITNKVSTKYEQVIKDLCKNKEEVISLSCSLEAEVAQLEDSEKKDFLSSLGLKEPALNHVIRKTYEQLKLITFFTAGEQEVRAWTTAKDSTAPEAGGVIHSDFEKGFIRAEVYSYEDLLKYKSEKELKNKGLFRSEGKTYIVKDGDIILFRFNV